MNVLGSYTENDLVRVSGYTLEIDMPWACRGGDAL
jgi:hypothetical protein